MTLVAEGKSARIIDWNGGLVAHRDLPVRFRCATWLDNGTAVLWDTRGLLGFSEASCGNLFDVPYRPALAWATQDCLQIITKRKGQHVYIHPASAPSVIEGERWKVRFHERSLCAEAGNALMLFRPGFMGSHEFTRVEMFPFAVARQAVSWLPQAMRVREGRAIGYILGRNWLEARDIGSGAITFRTDMDRSPSLVAVSEMGWSAVLCGQKDVNLLSPEGMIVCTFGLSEKVIKVNISRCGLVVYVTHEHVLRAYLNVHAVAAVLDAADHSSATIALRLCTKVPSKSVLHELIRVRTCKPHSPIGLEIEAAVADISRCLHVDNDAEDLHALVKRCDEHLDKNYEQWESLFYEREALLARVANHPDAEVSEGTDIHALVKRCDEQLDKTEEEQQMLQAHRDTLLARFDERPDSGHPRAITAFHRKKKQDLEDAMRELDAKINAIRGGIDHATQCVENFRQKASVLEAANDKLQETAHSFLDSGEPAKVRQLSRIAVEQKRQLAQYSSSIKNTELHRSDLERVLNDLHVERLRMALRIEWLGDQIIMFEDASLQAVYDVSRQTVWRSDLLEEADSLADAAAWGLAKVRDVVVDGACELNGPVDAEADDVAAEWERSWAHDRVRGASQVIEDLPDHGLCREHS